MKLNDEIKLLGKELISTREFLVNKSLRITELETELEKNSQYIELINTRDQVAAWKKIAESKRKQFSEKVSALFKEGDVKTTPVGTIKESQKISIEIDPAINILQWATAHAPYLLEVNQSKLEKQIVFWDENNPAAIPEGITVKKEKIHSLGVKSNLSLDDLEAMEYESND